MFKIIKKSITWKKGSLEGRHVIILKEYEKQYKTERAAKMILTKLSWEVENETYPLNDGFLNSVRWEVTKIN